MQRTQALTHGRPDTSAGMRLPPRGPAAGGSASPRHWRSAVVLASLLWAATGWADLGPNWNIVGGNWSWTREVVPMIRQGSPTETCLAIWKDVSSGLGAWRATVEPAAGAQEVGIWFLGTQDPTSGFLATLGGNPGVGGLVLRTGDGQVLWEDRRAPWRPYQPYVLEAVAEPGRIRAQLLEGDAKTLISQSPWVSVPQEQTQPGRLAGLFTRNAIARFWGWTYSDTPLVETTDEAPNYRRLVQDDTSSWTVVGPGNWMWTTRERRRLRQYATVERSSAINRAITGAARAWECQLRVDPGTGGAGMLFQTDESVSTGFLAWLGGARGAGSLMLYSFPLRLLWSGEQDRWHYDADYLLRAETRVTDAGGQVRVQLFTGDGETLIDESPWLPIAREEAERVGALGFMTWQGTAEFWGFSEDTSGAEATAAPPASVAATSSLGDAWACIGEGVWEWADEARTVLRQTSQAPRALAVNRAVTGIMGKWRVRVRVAEGTEAAGLAFQASRDGRQGFAALLTSGGFTLQELGGRELWRDPTVQWERQREYVLEGEVMTDRVAVRLLSPEDERILSECPAVYVSETNNRRTGHIGVITHNGAADFSGWELR